MRYALGVQPPLWAWSCGFFVPMELQLCCPRRDHVVCRQDWPRKEQCRIRSGFKLTAGQTFGTKYRTQSTRCLTLLSYIEVMQAEGAEGDWHCQMFLEDMAVILRANRCRDQWRRLTNVCSYQNSESYQSDACATFAFRFRTDLPYSKEHDAKRY